jgi:putative ABC transport system substrate-binding protein
VLSYLVDPIAAPQVKELESAAASQGMKLLVRDIRTADDLPAAFDAGARERAEGLLTTAENSLLSANEWSNSRPNTDCRECTLPG